MQAVNPSAKSAEDLRSSAIQRRFEFLQQLLESLFQPFDFLLQIPVF